MISYKITNSLDQTQKYFFHKEDNNLNRLDGYSFTTSDGQELYISFSQELTITEIRFYNNEKAKDII